MGSSPITSGPLENVTFDCGTYRMPLKRAIFCYDVEFDFGRMDHSPDDGSLLFEILVVELGRCEQAS